VEGGGGGKGAGKDREEFLGVREKRLHFGLGECDAGYRGREGGEKRLIGVQVSF